MIKNYREREDLLNACAHGEAGFVSSFVLPYRFDGDDVFVLVEDSKHGLHPYGGKAVSHELEIYVGENDETRTRWFYDSTLRRELDEEFFGLWRYIQTKPSTTHMVDRVQENFPVPGTKSWVAERHMLVEVKLNDVCAIRPSVDHPHKWIKLGSFEHFSSTKSGAFECAVRLLERELDDDGFTAEDY